MKVLKGNLLNREMSYKNQIKDLKRPTFMKKESLLFALLLTADLASHILLNQFTKLYCKNNFFHKHNQTLIDFEAK